MTGTPSQTARAPIARWGLKEAEGKTGRDLILSSSSDLAGVGRAGDQGIEIAANFGKPESAGQSLYPPS